MMDKIKQKMDEIRQKYEIRLKIQRVICWLFGHKHVSSLHASSGGYRWFVLCLDCSKILWLDDKESEETTRLYANIDEEAKLINDVIEDEEKSAIKIKEQKRRNGVFAKQKRVKKNG